MLKNTKSALKTKYEIDKQFQTITGVIQGSVLSPLLYGVFINDLLEQLDNSKLGVNILNEHIPALFYCDDIILITDNTTNLKKLLNICQNHSIKWHYNFNPKKCNIISNNYIEPIQEMITNNNTHRNQILQQEFETQIPFYYKTHHKNTIIAPLIIEQKINSQTYRGYNIKGIKTYWNINIFNKKLRNSIIKFFNNPDITPNHKYIIHWKNLPNFHKSEKQWMRNNLTLYGKFVKYKNNCRYLGAQLCDTNKGIISDHLTNKSFTKRLFSKEYQLLNTIQMQFRDIHLNVKIPLIRTFFLAYTEIFGQILPNTENMNLNKISINNQIKLCNIKIDRIDKHQFKTFIGIPSPSQRWIILKLLYYQKLLKNPNKTIFNKWINYNLNFEIPMFLNFRSLIRKWLPKKTKLQISDKKYTANHLKKDIIKQMTINNLNKMHKYHPFNILKFKTDKFVPFYTSNIMQSQSFYTKTKKRHFALYHDIFYNFGWCDRKCKRKQTCNICHSKIKSKSMLHHISTNCIGLNEIRKHFWINAHNILVQIYNTLDNTHQNRYGYEVLKILENIPQNTKNFYRIILGANMIHSNNSKIWYNPYIASHSQNKSLNFLNTLLSLNAHWITIAKDMFTEPDKINRRISRIKIKPINYHYRHYISNQIYLDKFLTNNNYNPSQILIFTDGSYHYKTKFSIKEHSGIGIYIIHDNNLYYFRQTLGIQQILYCETYAIAIIPKLLKKLQININNKIYIFTDNQIIFNIIHKISNNFPYPKLAHTIRNFLNNNIIISKVKAHAKNYAIHGNEIADRLANKAAVNRYKTYTTTPWFNWENSKLTCRDTSCCGLTTDLDLLDTG